MCYQPFEFALNFTLIYLWFRVESRVAGCRFAEKFVKGSVFPHGCVARMLEAARAVAEMEMRQNGWMAYVRLRSRHTSAYRINWISSKSKVELATAVCVASTTNTSLISDIQRVTRTETAVCRLTRTKIVVFLLHFFRRRRRVVMLLLLAPQFVKSWHNRN